MELRESRLVEKDAALHPDPVAEATPEDRRVGLLEWSDPPCSQRWLPKPTRSSRRAKPQPRSIDVQRSMPSIEALARNKDLPTLLPFSIASSSAEFLQGLNCTTATWMYVSSAAAPVRV